MVKNNWCFLFEKGKSKGTIGMGGFASFVKLKGQYISCIIDAHPFYPPWFVYKLQIFDRIIYNNEYVHVLVANGEGLLLQKMELMAQMKQIKNYQAMKGIIIQT